MASIGHVAVGLAAGRWLTSSGGAPFHPLLWMVALSVLSLLPDADAVGFLIGVPYAAPFGHRGASHSLVAAALLALFCTFGAALCGLRGAPLRRVGWVCLAVVASHGLLDALTRGGLGVALLWPFSQERHFAPLRPLPVAPIGLRLLSPRGLRVMAIELIWFAPLFYYALRPTRTERQADP